MGQLFHSHSNTHTKKETAKNQNHQWKQIKTPNSSNGCLLISVNFTTKQTKTEMQSNPEEIDDYYYQGKSSKGIMGVDNRRCKEDRRLLNLPIAKPSWISNTKPVHKQPKQKLQQKTRDNTLSKPQIGVTFLTLIFPFVSCFSFFFRRDFPLSFRVTEKVRNWDLIAAVKVWKKPMTWMEKTTK